MKPQPFLIIKIIKLNNMWHIKIAIEINDHKKGKKRHARQQRSKQSLLPSHSRRLGAKPSVRDQASSTQYSIHTPVHSGGGGGGGGEGGKQEHTSVCKCHN